jgi:hypothetical protein
MPIIIFVGPPVVLASFVSEAAKFETAAAFLLQRIAVQPPHTHKFYMQRTRPATKGGCKQTC